MLPKILMILESIFLGEIQILQTEKKNNFNCFSTLSVACLTVICIFGVYLNILYVLCGPLKEFL